MFREDVENYRKHAGACGGYYTGSAKKRFANAAKRYLRQVAKELGLTPDQYDLRFNPGGPAVSGEATLHTDNVYVQVTGSFMWKNQEIMYRACNGRKDYKGGRNHYAPAGELDYPANFANTLERLYMPRSMTR